MRSSENTVDDHTVDILILGGGLAGLGAAIQIKNSESNNGKKYSFRILEAQDQVGGRVKSHKLFQFSKSKNHINIDEKNQRETNEGARLSGVDIGAQWLHGRDNFLYAIAERYRLLSAHETEEGLGSFFYENCKQIDSFFVKKVDFHIGQLLHECEQFTKTKSTHPKSVGHFLRDRFQQFTDNLDNPHDKAVAKDLFDWHMRFQLIDNSCLSLDHLSAKYWGKYSLNGESHQAHYSFTNGFHTVVECLINELGSDLIHCNKEIFEICINDNRNKVNNNRRPANITVKCCDGSVYRANIVLVTFSLGVLKKKHDQLFRPPLPRNIKTAIESIGFQTINKIFLEFNTPWWNELDGIQLVFSHREKVFCLFV